jgi:prophage regulatory protein
MRVIPYGRLSPDKGIKYCRDHLRKKCKAGEFPKPIQISDKRIAWIEDEIDAWLAAKLKARDEGNCTTDDQALAFLDIAPLPSPTKPNLEELIEEAARQSRAAPAGEAKRKPRGCGRRKVA